MADFIVKGLILSVALLVTGLVVIDDSDAVVRFEPRTNTPTTSPIRLNVIIDAKIPVNVVSGTITYPPEKLTVSVEHSPSSPIDIWLTRPENNTERGEILFSGGTSDSAGIVGVHALFAIIATATTSEYVELSVKDLEVYAHDGQGKQVQARHEIYAFNRPIESAAPGMGSGISTNDTAVLKSRSDFDADGTVSLVDLSIMLIKITGPYHTVYDINDDSTLNLADLSALLSVIGK